MYVCLKCFADPSVIGEAPRWTVFELSPDSIKAACEGGEAMRSRETLEETESQRRELEMLEDRMQDYTLKLRSVNHGIVENDEQLKAIEDEYQIMEEKLRFLSRKASILGVKSDAWPYDKGSLHFLTCCAFFILQGGRGGDSIY